MDDIQISISPEEVSRMTRSIPEARKSVIDFKLEIKRRLRFCFKQLRKEGVYARANFLCCNACAGSTIFRMRKEDPDGFGKKFYGLCFYHAQDNEELEAGRNFCITFTSFEDGRESEVAQHVLSVLNKNGITASWDSNIAHRISVSLQDLIARRLCELFSH